MVKKLMILVLGMTLASFNVLAAEKVTAEQIREVILATDTAAVNQDTRGIGVHLGDSFFKYIEVTTEEIPLAVQLTKQQYLDLIERGWETIEKYSYLRKDVVINVARDGSRGESNSTIIETIRTDGKDMVSKVREYAQYELENGRTVIVSIESQTLVGDTTPE
ncbi:MAG TPA: hypothetical protein ENJ80_13425 [Gammaproteobacteria bacterium]|nr:hypothetical protein [Gammaproteobacteria bacterium]